MPSPHACMPLFTTWYALIPGIILCLTGGIRPYAPRHVDVHNNTRVVVAIVVVIVVDVVIGVVVVVVVVFVVGGVAGRASATTRRLFSGHQDGLELQRLPAAGI
eukprot:COSAG06_NODE_31_length_31488_cov_60.882793_3_plen_104_part_00